MDLDAVDGSVAERGAQVIHELSDRRRSGDAKHRGQGLRWGWTVHGERVLIRDE